jgi:hypothetical protein
VLEDVPHLEHGEFAFGTGGCEVSENLEWLAQIAALRDDEVLEVEHLLDYVEYGLYMKVFMSRYENTQNLTIILDPLIL